MPSSGSSSTPSPWTTNARSVPSRRRTSASRGAAAGSPTPTTWRRDAGRVRQRAEQVERRPDADLAAGRAGVRHRRMEARGEQEGEAVGRAGPRRPTSASWSIRMPSASSTSAEPEREVIARLPCLATGHPGRGHDECRRRRDVERAAPVAAGPDDVDRAVPARRPAGPARASPWRSRPARRPSRRASAGRRAGPPAGPASPRRPSPRPWRARASSIDSVLAVDDRGEGRPDELAHRPPPRGRRAAAGSIASRHARPVANEPLAASSRPASPSPARRRKLASRCGPSGVRTDSGWNWTPSSGRRRVADAHDDAVRPRSSR